MIFKFTVSQHPFFFVYNDITLCLRWGFYHWHNHTPQMYLYRLMFFLGSEMFSWISLMQVYTNILSLAHLALEKMAAISQTTFSNAFFQREVFYFDRMLLKFVPEGPFDNKAALVQVMALTIRIWLKVIWYITGTYLRYFGSSELMDNLKLGI